MFENIFSGFLRKTCLDLQIWEIEEIIAVEDEFGHAIADEDIQELNVIRENVVSKLQTVGYLSKKVRSTWIFFGETDHEGHFKETRRECVANCWIKYICDVEQCDESFGQLFAISYLCLQTGKEEYQPLFVDFRSGLDNNSTVKFLLSL